MRAVVQRVNSASVVIVEQGTTVETGKIGRGCLVLLGIHTDDTEEDAVWLGEKIAGLRIFEDDSGRLNLALGDIGGSVLLVPNFTLYADCRKGRRPSFAAAASGAEARSLYERFGRLLEERQTPVQYGRFGADMRVMLENDGPVTLVIDTPPRAQ